MKDKKAFIFYILISLVLWQLCVSLTKIPANFAKSGNISDFKLFSIVQTANKGAAFGMLQNGTVVLSVLGVIVLLLVMYHVFKFVKFEDKMKILCCSVFSAGIIGNTVQRIVDGSVFDFIKLNFINFPIFNFFDILICVSVFVYIFYFIKEEKNEG